jgi:hypothetical protein
MLINYRRQISVLVLVLIGISLTMTGGRARTLGPEPLVLTANGKGTIKVGSESFQVTSVVVKLGEDGKLEITLVSEITFFVSGKWKVASESPKTYDLDITGSMTGGGAKGTGKLVLRADGTSIDHLTAQGGSTTSSRKVFIDFVAS